MAEISVTLDPSAAPEIKDEGCTKDPYEGAGWVERGLRYAWLDLHCEGGDKVTIHIGHGLATDEQIVANLEPLLLAVERMRDAARDRIQPTPERPKDVRDHSAFGRSWAAADPMLARPRGRKRARKAAS